MTHRGTIIITTILAKSRSRCTVLAGRNPVRTGRPTAESIAWSTVLAGRLSAESTARGAVLAGRSSAESTARGAVRAGRSRTESGAGGAVLARRGQVLVVGREVCFCLQPWGQVAAHRRLSQGCGC